MAESVYDRLCGHLQQQGVRFDTQRHQAVFTSEEAARVRGTTLSSGAKALVCKADDRFVMIVVPADRKLASKRTRKDRALRKLRFANREEVRDITRLEPGAIPPFGSLFALPTWCDAALADEARINFNAGDHSISISMSYADFVRVEHPELGNFTEQP